MKRSLPLICLLLWLMPNLLNAQAVTDGLVAYWSLDGNGNDQIGGYNGTVAGATLTTDRHGNSDMAYSFDGTNDYINVPYNTVFDLGTGDLSISMWIKASGTQTSSWPSIFYHGAGSYTIPGYNIRLNATTGILYFSICNGTTRLDMSTTVTVNDDTWHHIVAVYDRDGMATFYIDGVNRTANGGYDITAYASEDIVYSYPILISYLNYAGCTDEVMFFNRTLTEAEILQLYSYYSLTVTDGSGSGTYEPGETITITANTAPAGYTFDQWTGDLSYVADRMSAQTTVTMPEQDITVAAAYKVITSPWTESDDAITFSGTVGIGTTTIPEGYTLAVDGKIIAKEVKVTLDGWADFVFNPAYPLMPLLQLEEFIKQNGHLPSVPSEEEVKANGVDVGDMNAIMLQKIEELTLYIIEQQKQIDELKKQLGNKEK